MSNVFQIIGNNRLFPELNDSGNADVLIAGPCCVCPIPGKVITVTVMVSAAAGNLRVGIYSDSGGAPNALLAESASTAAVAGWQQITLTAPATLAEGAAFWIVTLCDNNGLSISQELFAAGGSELNYYAGFAYGALPNPFPTPDGTSNKARSAFCRIDPP